MKPVSADLKKVVIFSHFATTGACEELCEWLKQNGIRELIYVAFPFGHCRDRFIRAERFIDGKTVGIRRSLFRLKMPEPLAYAKDFVYALLYSFRFAHGADVVVAGDNLLALACALSRPLSGIKRVVYYMIDYSPVRYANRCLNAFYYWVDRLAAYRADAVWPLTPQIIRGRFDSGRLEERRVRWYTVPYGSHPVETADVGFSVTQVVYMGDVVRNKGAELFVPMALELKRRIPQFTFTVIGGGKDLPLLRAEVEKAGLKGHIEVIGFVDSIAEVVEKLNGGGVAIAPYYPFDANSFTFFSDPGKVKVYLGCGLPIVMTDVPPIAKTLEGEGAGCIAAYDAADFAEKVASLMQSSNYLKYRENARRLGRQYEWNKVFSEAFAQLDCAFSTGRSPA